MKPSKIAFIYLLSTWAPEGPSELGVSGLERGRGGPHKSQTTRRKALLRRRAKRNLAGEASNDSLSLSSPALTQNEVYFGRFEVPGAATTTVATATTTTEEYDPYLGLDGSLSMSLSISLSMDLGNIQALVTEPPTTKGTEGTTTDATTTPPQKGSKEKSTKGASPPAPTPVTAPLVQNGFEFHTSEVTEEMSESTSGNTSHETHEKSRRKRGSKNGKKPGSPPGPPSPPASGSSTRDGKASKRRARARLLEEKARVG